MYRQVTDRYGLVARLHRRRHLQGLDYYRSFLSYYSSPDLYDHGPRRPVVAEGQDPPALSSMIPVPAGCTSCLVFICCLEANGLSATRTRSCVVVISWACIRLLRSLRKSDRLLLLWHSSIHPCKSCPHQLSLGQRSER